MPRQPRTESGTGIFHVMMRGINHQNIFEDEEDNYQFINTLDRMRVRYDDEGNPCGSNCTYYAYCLMGNHFHLLIREREESVGETVKRIASSYVYYYNRKYGRDGHLFKERLTMSTSVTTRQCSSELGIVLAVPSVQVRARQRYGLLHGAAAVHTPEPTHEARAEPNSFELCLARRRKTTVNPVKAGIVERVKDYEYSSWGEFDGTVEPVFQICDVNIVLNRIPFKELEEWVNDPLDDDIQCLEIENKVYSKPSDDQVWLLIKEQTGATSSTAFQQLADEIKRNILKQLKDSGASHRQLERLTGVGRGLIQKL